MDIMEDHRWYKLYVHAFIFIVKNVYSGLKMKYSVDQRCVLYSHGLLHERENANVEVGILFRNMDINIRLGLYASFLT